MNEWGIITAGEVRFSLFLDIRVGLFFGLLSLAKIYVKIRAHCYEVSA